MPSERDDSFFLLTWWPKLIDPSAASPLTGARLAVWPSPASPGAGPTAGWWKQRSVLAPPSLPFVDPLARGSTPPLAQGSTPAATGLLGLGGRGGAGSAKLQCLQANHRAVIQTDPHTTFQQNQILPQRGTWRRLTALTGVWGEGVWVSLGSVHEGMTLVAGRS